VVVCVWIFYFIFFSRSFLLKHTYLRSFYPLTKNLNPKLFSIPPPPFFFPSQPLPQPHTLKCVERIGRRGERGSGRGVDFEASEDRFSLEEEEKSHQTGASPSNFDFFSDFRPFKIRARESCERKSCFLFLFIFFFGLPSFFLPYFSLLHSFFFFLFFTLFLLSIPFSFLFLFLPFRISLPFSFSPTTHPHSFVLIKMMTVHGSTAAHESPFTFI